ncbi:MAG: glycerate kinase [Flavobacterium sp.]|nr:glycerate kinase [Flavobacterium sp.]
MTILVALDKFKGSLTTFQANEIVHKAIKQVYPTSTIYNFPMADGGDGFSDVMQHYLQTKTVIVPTVNALLEPITSNYQWNDKNSMALIEVAKASGMQQLAKHQLNPLHTTTYGTGLLIKYAIKSGAKKIMLGLGGSATNDGGIGILSALGFQFLDASGYILAPIGLNLSAVSFIKKPSNGFTNIEFELACDVDNVLYGQSGAAHVYAAQKGASKIEIAYLDEGLQHLAKLLMLQCGIDYSETKGCGAAGGIPVALLSFFNAKIRKGIDLVLEQSNLLNLAAKADLLITGEGKIDNQSLHGKVVSSIASIAKFHRKPCIAYCGVNASNNSFNDAFKNIFALKNNTITEQYAIENASSLLFELVKHTIASSC